MASNGDAFKDKKSKAVLNLQVSFALDMMLAEPRHWHPWGAMRRAAQPPGDRIILCSTLRTLEKNWEQLFIKNRFFFVPAHPSLSFLTMLHINPPCRSNCMQQDRLEKKTCCFHCLHAVLLQTDKYRLMRMQRECESVMLLIFDLSF